MCGILGSFYLRHDDSLDQRIQAGMNAMRHRGPDSQGVASYSVANGVIHFGHARLSIIDLTSGGHQPMSSKDGRFTIVFNGEIYNYTELRDELKQQGCGFASDSDTEVLLTAWAVWGSACLQRLTGMFAFAIFDKFTNTLTCVRDAFGIKPFFYFEKEGQFVFASELPALLKLLPSKPELNWQRSYDYLVHGDYDSSNETFFAGVQHLMPGHWIQMDLNSRKLMEPQRWWTPKTQEKVGWSFDDAVEQVRAQFLNNIKLHLRSDVPVGAALSGGVDSSAVVCAMRYVEPDIPIHTFSYIAKGSVVNEEYWVDRVNRHVGAVAHKVSLTPKDLERDLDDMIYAQGEPFGSTSIYAQYRVYQLARDAGITVTLDGQGADEMLAGYSGYPGQRIRSLLELGEFSDAWFFLNNWAKWPGRNHLMGVKYLVSEMTEGHFYDFLRKLDGKPSVPSWINPDPLIECGVVLRKGRARPETQTKGRRLIDELALSLSKRGVASLLRHGDRNSMRFSIESRVPFLTPDMSNLLLSLPESFLISQQGETKHVFRAAMRGIVPDDVLDRKDKIGFETPELEWFREMRSTVRVWLCTNIPVPFLNQKLILEEFDAVLDGKAEFSWRLWRWINFTRWYARFFN